MNKLASILLAASCLLACSPLLFPSASCWASAARESNDTVPEPMATDHATGHAVPPYPFWEDGNDPNWLQTAAEHPWMMGPILEGINNPQIPKEPVEGERHVLVIPVDFSDNPKLSRDASRSELTELLFSETAGAYSMRDYYRKNSNGNLTITGEVVDYVRSDYSYNTGPNAYVNRDGIYGTDDDWGFDYQDAGFPHPRSVWGLVLECLDKVDSYLDFSDFDRNSDGEIDGLVIVHSGQGAEVSCGPGADSLDCVSVIWSHMSQLSWFFEEHGFTQAQIDSALTRDGILIDIYDMQPAYPGRGSDYRYLLGVFCHEYGHVLGLPDLYSSLGGMMQVPSCGRFCLMATGSWCNGGASPCNLSAWCRYVMGWLEPVAVDSDPSTPLKRLDEAIRPPIEPYLGNVYRIRDNPNGMDWDWDVGGNGEYFLLENRFQEGYDLTLPGSGLLIWHIDESRPNNDDVSNPLARVVQADGGSIYEMWMTNGERTDLWPADCDGCGRHLTHNSRPNSRLFSGGYSGVSVTDITRDYDNMTIRANLYYEVQDPSYPVDIPTYYVYPNPFVTSEESRGRCTFAYRPQGAPVGSFDFTVYIFDSSGSLVKVLDDGSEVSKELGHAYWDGNNEGGTEVASGNYIFLLKGQGEEQTGVVSIVR